MADEYTREQELLKKLRDEKCSGNAAELARKLKKDATYVNRLLYPVGKKGRKGIGLEVMRAATEAFHLPAGFWEGADAERKGAVLERLTDREKAMLYNYRRILDKDRDRFDSEISKAAEERQQEADELFARFGVAKAVERANARRQDTSSTTAHVDDSLRQGNLFDPPGDKRPKPR